MMTQSASRGAARPRAPRYLAIPARNEADDIAACLRALAAQQGVSLDGVVLCLNNCTDATPRIVRDIAPSLPFATHVLHVTLPPNRACAGVARRMAMQRAADLAGPDGVLLTTDADSQVAPDWLAGNLAALHAGADAVAGRAEIDPVAARLIPAHLHAIDARECAYAMLLDEIASLIDPDPADPWPRHDEHSGASIAVTVAAYRRAGGMPDVPLAEDRAFFDALRLVDARIRHAPAVRVTVSARIEGRAVGGMADTIRRRIEQVDEWLDDRLEPVTDAAARLWLRAELRAAWQRRADDPASVGALATSLGVSAGQAGLLVQHRYFGAAWAEAEAVSPSLRRRRRVRLAELSAQTVRALMLRDGLRQVEKVSAA